MTEAAEAAMPADEAADLLAGIEDVEEEMTARTAGLTWLVWGLAIPGLFTSYAALQPVVAEGPFEWILSVLWIPWIVAGSLATNALWAVNAVTLDREPEGGGGWTSLGFVVLFFALAGASWALTSVLGVDLPLDALWIVAAGLLTVAIGAVFRRRQAPGGGLAAAGGLTIVAGGLAVGVVDPSPSALVNLAGAALVGLIYHAVGGWLYLRG